MALAPRATQKTAALCYDRVWALPTAEIPDNIRCFGDTRFEREFLLSLLLFKSIPEISSLLFEIRGLPNDDPSGLRGTYGGLILDDLRRKLFVEMLESPVTDDIASRFLAQFARGAARAFAEELGTSITPIYASHEDYDWQYRAGDRSAVVAVIENLGLVDEEHLTWEQVCQFRNDADAKSRYRRFLHWLDKDMVGKSQTFVQDEVAIRLEDYKRALQKHGIRTVVGTVSEALDGKYLLGAAGMASASTLTGSPSMGFLVGAGLVLGKVAVKLMQVAFDYDDVERGKNSEISWLFEVEQEFGKDKGV